jgi:protein SCO1/2
MKPLTGATITLALALLQTASLAASADLGRRGFTGTVEYAQHLGRSLPAELRFRDERGNAVHLGDYLGTSPLGVVFAYYHCSNLCPMQIRNLAQRLAQTSGGAATQAQMLVVSIDPLDSPAQALRAKHEFLDNLLPPERIARWHFLSGAAADIARLTEAVGFRYGYDQATHQYAHAAGFALITPEGTIARYFFGFDFTANELGQAFTEAASRRVASPIERLLLVCFHYDLANGPYSALIVKVLRVASIVMLLGMLALASILRARARRPRTSET